MKDAVILGVVLAAFIVALSCRRERVGDVLVPYASANFRNGDVVLENGRGLDYEILTSMLSRSCITHVGVVCHDASGAPFIFHTSRHGARLCALHVWFRRATRTNRVFVRHVSTHIPNRDMEAAVAPLLGTPYTYRFWKAVLRQWVAMELPGASDEQAGMFCSEIICRVFERLGLLDFSDSPLSPALALPCHFEAAQLPWVGVRLSEVRELSAGW